MTSVRLAVLQLKGNAPREVNLERSIAKIHEAIQAGAQVICLQELFTGPYPCQSEDHAHFDWAEPIPGPTTDELAAIAKRHAVVIVAPLFERRSQAVYHNSVAVLDADGSLAGMYRKMHIPDDPLFYEKFYFTPGDRGFCVIPTRYAKLGVGICWDQWYPEAARLFALAGAEILLYPTAIGWIHKEKQTHGKWQHQAWQTMMRSHAVANGLWLGAPNRVGIEEELEFWGASFIASPNGTLVAEANHTDEAVVIADCDFEQSKYMRTHWPFFRDRRIDAFAGLTQRWLD